MNDYLKSIQDENRLYAIRSLFSDCSARYLKSASLVGMHNEHIKHLKDHDRFFTDGFYQIMEAIEERYNYKYCDDQIQIFESFEKTTERRWFSFAHKVKLALVENNQFCRSILRLGGFLDKDDNALALPTALQIIHDIDLRWYISDEPKREDNED
ncbi:MAG: hypothetical protein PHY48_08690 [Candidatus Cloacimonetes bacterium]|jgi:hypothetical protein|nr:hypothetical protein [Candidatus Cloacimonadota bacterium]